MITFQLWWEHEEKMNFYKFLQGLDEWVLFNAKGIDFGYTAPFKPSKGIYDALKGRISKEHDGEDIGVHMFIVEKTFPNATSVATCTQPITLSAPIGVGSNASLHSVNDMSFLLKATQNDKSFRAAQIKKYDLYGKKKKA